MIQNDVSGCQRNQRGFITEVSRTLDVGAPTGVNESLER